MHTATEILYERNEIQIQATFRYFIKIPRYTIIITLRPQKMFCYFSKNMNRRNLKYSIIT